mgnify:CR=1 FL=1
MSIQFDVRRTVKVPIEKAFQALLDLDAAKEWMQGLVRMERLDEGPMREGSEWRETRKMFGTEATEQFEVIELQKPNKIVLRCDGAKGTTGKGEFIYTYTLQEVDGHSEILLSGEINKLTGMAKFFGKMMSKTFAKACAKDLDALKIYLERK